ncbi:unnamed protein product [Eruca vesicaria subsp. sativa]|uniref:Phospholipase/carboxylesterase/thioesterase domain-containing protein n=1 Tax=Eruca vesicaria subsp. sativa TaxID=29727 RepID=A0ABC8LML2_ERUVS|nr:unnamed protein product [Eruca vesicaria subsp. sativa]
MMEFGTTHEVSPIGKHQATIVWLHGIGENGSNECFVDDVNLLSPRTLVGKLEEEQIKNQAASLPISVCHGKDDNVAPFKLGEKCSQALISYGFKKTTFKSYSRYGHYRNKEETDDMCAWLTTTLDLQGYNDS